MNAFPTAVKAETATRPAALTTIAAEILAKRAADAIRFRTCCADPRASK